MTFDKNIVGGRHRCVACEDFDLCSSCYKDRKTLHNANHAFYRIQYYRLDVPPVKGEDLSMIRRFIDDDSRESFYLNYPWLFNSNIFNKLVTGTVDENFHRSQVDGISEYLGDDDAQIYLDSYIRTCASEAWNHQAVYEEVKELTSIQLIRAEASECHFSAWKRLSQGLTEPHSNPIHSYIKQQKSFSNQKAEQNHFEGIIELFSSYCDQREEEWKRQDSGSVTANLSTRSRYLKTLALDTGVSENREALHVVFNAISGGSKAITNTRRC